MNSLLLYKTVFGRKMKQVWEKNFLCPQRKRRENSLSRGEGGPEGVGRGMRAVMLDYRKLEDLLQGTISNPGIGLLCCTDFQFSARIPLPTRFSELRSGGPPSPRGKGFWTPVPFPTIKKAPSGFGWGVLGVLHGKTVNCSGRCTPGFLP